MKSIRKKIEQKVRQLDFIQIIFVDSWDKVPRTTWNAYAELNGQLADNIMFFKSIRGKIREARLIEQKIHETSQQQDSQSQNAKWKSSASE